MFCKNCETKLDDGVKFCPNCGRQTEPDEPKPKKSASKPAAPKEAACDVKISDNITLSDDGKYRWVYEMNLFKNPTIFLLVWKIFFFIFLGIFAVVIIADAANWGWAHAAGNLPFLGYFLIGMTVVIALGYSLYAAIMGGKYIVEFEMDGRGVSHKQTASQAKKAKNLGRATMIAGAATGRIGTVGVGMNAQRTEMYSEFARVKKVKAYPKRHLIKLSEFIEHNQVYAADADFEFVKNFIVTHCPNIKM